MYLIGKRISEGAARAANRVGARKIEMSAAPAIHPDEQLALGEANRLANQMGGQYEFVVFKAVAMVKPKDVPTEVVRLDA
jgi:hypothetical protein